MVKQISPQRRIGPTKPFGQRVRSSHRPNEPVTQEFPFQRRAPAKKLAELPESPARLGPENYQTTARLHGIYGHPHGRLCRPVDSTGVCFYFRQLVSRLPARPLNHAACLRWGQQATLLALELDTGPPMGRPRNHPRRQPSEAYQGECLMEWKSAFEEGVDAFDRGRSREGCPYQKGDHRREFWLEGWKKAKETDDLHVDGPPSAWANSR